MRRVFVDSGGFFAHLVRQDASHADAKALFVRALEEGWQMVSTNAVLFETHALLLTRVRDGRAVGLRFLETVQEGLCHVERVSPGDESAAIAL